jgi:uncharacterized repeat protein (TIGR01451 family)
MDYSITPATPPRSLVRRFATWTAALGLLGGGGGFGAYRYAPALGLWGELPTEQAAAAEPSAETSSDRLMAAMPLAGASTSDSNRYTTPQGAASDRYAAGPMLPPAAEDDEVTTPRSAAAVEAPVNPFNTAPVGSDSDRYAAPAPPAADAAAVTPPAAPPIAAAADASHDAVEAAPLNAAAEATDVLPPSEPDLPAAAEPAVAEVARGQEPGSVNPLRSATRSIKPAAASEPGDARAAFGDAPTPAPPAELSIRRDASAEVASETASKAAVDATDASAATGLTPVPDSRYAAGGVPASPPTIATPGATGYGAAAQFASSPSPAYSAISSAPSAQLTPAPEAAADSYAAPLSPTADPGITPTPGLATADGTGRPGERILEGQQTPALNIQKLAPPEIQVGKKCTFAIRVQNNSQRTAHNVKVLDEVPLGTQLVGTAPKADVSGAQVVWDLGTLSAGEERIVEMELMPTAEGELGSVATVTFATQASAKARSTRPQLALRLSSNPRVMIGEQQVVQIEVTNPGTGDATGVMLLESIPQGVSHEAGPALEFEVGTLRAGETKKMELVLQADAAGLIDNVMTARADANLQVQANCQFEVIAPALKVSVEGPQKRYLERPATYTVSVDNPGTASAREVQLVTKLDKGLKFVSANNMGEYDAATHSVYWSLPELPANQRGTVELTALPVEQGDQTLQFATRAAQGLEDRTEAHITVEGIVALSFEVQDVEDAIEVGGETAYEIRVVNQGSKAATNVQVVALMPAGLRAQAGQGDSRYQVQGDRVAFAPLPSLAAKADATFRLRVQGIRPGDQRVSVQVTTDEVREPITQVESTQVYADE